MENLKFDLKYADPNTVNAVERAADDVLETEMKKRGYAINKAYPKFALTTHYTFDSEVPVWLFATEDDAISELIKQYNEEIRIQTQENGHFIGEDMEVSISEDGTIATISMDFKDTKDVMTWTVSGITENRNLLNKPQ